VPRVAFVFCLWDVYLLCALFTHSRNCSLHLVSHIHFILPIVFDSHSSSNSFGFFCLTPYWRLEWYEFIFWYIWYVDFVQPGKDCIEKTSSISTYEKPMPSFPGTETFLCIFKLGGCIRFYVKNVHRFPPSQFFDASWKAYKQNSSQKLTNNMLLIQCKPTVAFSSPYFSSLCCFMDIYTIIHS